MSFTYILCIAISILVIKRLKCQVGSVKSSMTRYKTVISKYIMETCKPNHLYYTATNHKLSRVNPFIIVAWGTMHHLRLLLLRGLLMLALL